MGEGRRGGEVRRCLCFEGKDLSSNNGIVNLTFMLKGMCCARLLRPTTPVKAATDSPQQQNQGQPKKTPETYHMTALVYVLVLSSILGQCGLVIRAVWSCLKVAYTHTTHTHTYPIQRIKRPPFKLHGVLPLTRVLY